MTSPNLPGTSSSAITHDRAKRQPDRLGYEGSGETNDDPMAILDEEDEAPPDKPDPDDHEYMESPRNTKVALSRGRPKKAKWEAMDCEELVAQLVSMDKAQKEIYPKYMVVKKKRTEDRKELFGEKKARIALQKEVKQLKQEIQCLNDEKNRAHAAMLIQQEDFAKAQRDWIAKVHAQDYPCLPDNVIRDEFRDLLNSCRGWVKTWFRRDGNLQTEFLDGLMRPCLADDHIATRHRVREQVQSEKAKFSRSLGFACLVSILVRDVFGNPFDVFDQDEQQSLLRLRTNYEKADFKKAYAWRANTVRLFRQSLGLQPLQIRINAAVLPALKSFWEQRAESLIDKHLQAFTILRAVDQHEQTERLTELTAICRNASLLALEIWSQKSNLEIVENSVIFAQPFSIESDTHQPHVTMGADDEDYRFDGAKIDLVLTPALQIYGDSNGDHLKHPKIVSKAIVYVFDDLLCDKTASAADPRTSRKDLAVATARGNLMRRGSLQEPVSKRQKTADHALVIDKNTNATYLKSTTYEPSSNRQSETRNTSYEPQNFSSDRYSPRQATTDHHHSDGIPATPATPGDPLAEHKPSKQGSDQESSSAHTPLPSVTGGTRLREMVKQIGQGHTYQHDQGQAITAKPYAPVLAAFEKQSKPLTEHGLNAKKHVPARNALQQPEPAIANNTPKQKTSGQEQALQTLEHPEAK